jgi:acetyl esterase/lipase
MRSTTEHTGGRLAVALVAFGLLGAACAAGEPAAQLDTTTTTPPVEAAPSATTEAAPTTSVEPPADAGDAVALEPLFEVDVQAGIVYGTGATADGEIDLLLDAYLPVGDAPEPGWPAAVLIHGGGFRSGSRDDVNIAAWARELARRGIVTVSIDYRLLEDRPVVTGGAIDGYFLGLLEERNPFLDSMATVRGAAMEDALNAAAWLVEQGTDPDRIVIGGSSAGAITAVHAAYLPDNLGIDAVAFAGVLDLWGGFSSSLVGSQPDIDPGDPPIWIVHGTSDWVVPIRRSLDIEAAAIATGVEVVFHPVEGAGHSWRSIDIFEDTTADGTILFDDQLAFLGRVLSLPPGT